ncbi:cytochrome c oxidase assembly protein [Arthrobacter sp. ATA002]|uniref:cytochrome c oxidase assembly protein n=1 Tax=Arthrobacter sp. ATA002 TaxID=2991715 RepID=UPI002E37F63E|nr:cytochrome c oxidase assembly protein [Arthrobacter sp. ATA002]
MTRPRPPAAKVHDHGAGAFGAELLFLIPAVAAVAAYWAGTLSSRSRGWPVHRALLFTAGVGAVLATVLDPLAAGSHADFAVLAAAHILAGMLGPLLLVLSRPVSLALRTLDVVPARRLARILRSRPLRILTFPVTAAVLNIGGMLVMFRTGLFTAMQDSQPVHWLVTFHLAAAGYLYTAVLVGRDPMPHRAGFYFRAAVLIGATAAHNILAKTLYADPPPGVPRAAGETGALILYYGGGGVELALVILLCRQWYISARPRGSTTPRCITSRLSTCGRGRAAGTRTGFNDHYTPGLTADRRRHLRLGHLPGRTAGGNGSRGRRPERAVRHAHRIWKIGHLPGAGADTARCCAGRVPADSPAARPG